MTAWDLAMDPLMVAGGYWVWETQGDYFGIPLQNFWGWWLTTFTALFIYQAICAELRLPNPTPAGDVPLSWAILIYVIVGGSSVMMDFAFGLSGAGLTGLFAMLPSCAWIKIGIKPAFRPHRRYPESGGRVHARPSLRQ